jgi:cystathionine beta-synthase
MKSSTARFSAAGSGTPTIAHQSLLDFVGNTPLVTLNRLAPELPHQIDAKLEFLNPTGSIKDRMALYIIEDAERNGLIHPGDLLIDNSSGNTAVSVGMVGACKGYRTMFTVPDKTSQEKIDLIRSMGSEVVICPTDVPHDDPRSYYEMARRLAKEKGAFLIDQYHNPKNIDAHFATTGPEIWEQTGGEIDAVVAGIGTGGTLSGIGRYIKSKNPAIKIVAVDPIGSIFYDQIVNDRLIEPGRYYVEGLGSDTPCGALDPAVIDEIVQIDDQESFDWARRLMRTEGMIAGGSSGSALAGLWKWASRQSTAQRIVTLLPDSGMRYVSKFFNDDWLRQKGFSFEPGGPSAV